jgi:hypothetical protein
MSRMRFRVVVLIFSVFGANQLHAYINSGIWVMDCQRGLKKKQVYESNNRVSTTEFFHKDVSCQDEFFRFQTIGTVSYNDKNPSFIDFNYEDIYLSIFKQNLIDDFNIRKVCGLTNWTMGGAQKITGLKCAIFNFDEETQIPRVGDQKFGIFSLSDDKLFYGKNSINKDGSSPEKRPTQLDPTKAYILKNSL